MKFDARKYWKPLAVSSLFACVGLAAVYKKSEVDSFDNTEGRKRLSDFQLAEAQSGRAHTLKENEFADRKAQEAFSSPDLSKPKADAPEEEKTAQTPPTASEASSRVRAAELLGSTPPETPAVKLAPEPEKAAPESQIEKSRQPTREKSSRPARTPARSQTVEGVSLASDRSESRVATPPSPSYSVSIGTGVYAKNPPSVMAKLDDSEVTETLGSRSTFVRGDLLKMGSEYLAKISDTIDVRGSRKQILNINVIGKMTAHTINQPFVLVGEASLTEDGQKICIEIKHCIAPQSHSKAIACEGDVKGIDGSPCLKNEIYSPSIWPSVLRILGEAGSVYSLNRMSESVTNLGVLTDQTQSNALWSAAGAAWQKSFEMSAERLEKEREGGRAAGGSIVKVMITKDTSLW